MTNRLIKNDLLNDYFHRACEYFEKECKLKQCFRCQKYDHVNKTCRNDVKCDFCAYEHFFDECKAINDHKKYVNCEKKIFDVKLSVRRQNAREEAIEYHLKQ